MSEHFVPWPEHDPVVTFGFIGATNSQGIQFEGPRGVGIWMVSDANQSGYRNQALLDGRLSLMGHNARRSPDSPPPDQVDQPLTKKDGSPTENGKFVAALDAGSQPLVEVFRKVGPGKWMNHGVYRITNYLADLESGRRVFWFHAEREP